LVNLSTVADGDPAIRFRPTALEEDGAPATAGEVPAQQEGAE
jgi:hypothetical protein